MHQLGITTKISAGVRMIRAVLMLAVCCFVLGAAFAQEGLTVEVFATALDQQASSYGFSSGDGAIQPAEQSLAAALYQEVTDYTQYMSRVEQSSPENAVWLDQFEAQTADFNQQWTQAGENAPIDVRAQILSEAFAQWETEVNALEGQAVPDVRAQILSEAFEQWEREAETLQAAAPLDPRAEAIVNAVDQYSRYVEEELLQERLRRDPRAEAVVNAVDQYVASVDDEDPATVRRSVRDAARQAIN